MVKLQLSRSTAVAENYFKPIAQSKAVIPKLSKSMSTLSNQDFQRAV